MAEKEISIGEHCRTEDEFAMRLNCWIRSTWFSKVTSFNDRERREA